VFTTIIPAFNAPNTEIGYYKRFGIMIAILSPGFMPDFNKKPANFVEA